MAISNENSLLPEDEPVHGWYRFVLSFPPHLVRKYISEMAMDGRYLLDPFVGTGTTIIESCRSGINAYGCDALPINPYLIGAKKHAIAIRRDLIAKRANKVLVKYNELWDSGLFWQPDREAMALLLKNSISAEPFAKTCALLEAIHQCNWKSPLFKQIFHLVVADKLPMEFGNLKFGPEVGVGKIKDDADVPTIWREGVQRICDDKKTFEPGQWDHGFFAEIHDARTIADLQHRAFTRDENKFGMVFTSPPYPNEKDYTRTQRLEMVMLGFLKNKQQLQTIKRRMICSNTRNAYVDLADGDLVADVPVIRNICSDIEERRLELGKDSGFERAYHRVVSNYFGGMLRHLQSLREVMLPGAMCGYVVGDQASFLRVHIPTGAILMDLAERAGFIPERIDLFRTRPSTVTGQDLREEVVIFRCP